MVERFFIYGFCGILIEIFWTGLHALERGDRKLTGYTSMWMMPIYGSAVFLEPLCGAISFMPIILRGIIYMICIFAAEFASGYFIEIVVGQCPWDYKSAKYNVYGLIRLDYAPLWFALGLFFETGYRLLS